MEDVNEVPGLYIRVEFKFPSVPAAQRTTGVKVQLFSILVHMSHFRFQSVLQLYVQQRFAHGKRRPWPTCII